MGCDGGTIPKRDELVRTKKRDERADKSVQLMAQWGHCALSSNKLSPPIVSCPLGLLYNKEAIIEYLLNKESSPNSESVRHIRTMKDVVTLNLTEKPNYADKRPDNGGEYIDTHDSRFVCPVVGLEMNGTYRFCYIRTCGCVMSERALKEVKSEACHKCNKPFNINDDVIVINGNDEEVKRLNEKMQNERAKCKSDKRNMKRKTEECDAIGNGPSSSKAVKCDAIGNEPSSSKAVKRDTSNTKTSTSAIITEKAKNDYSVAKDPHASDTYKSLFTSHASAKNKPKAHWITFNPLYY